MQAMEDRLGPQVRGHGRRAPAGDPGPAAPVAAGGRGAVGRGVQGVGARRLRAGRAGDLGGPPPAPGPLLRRARRPAPPGRRRPRLRAPAGRRRPRRPWCRWPRRHRPVRIALGALGRVEGDQGELLTRFVRLIQVQRGDFNGQVLTVRRDDLLALACILDVTPEKVFRPPRGARRHLRNALAARARSHGAVFGLYVHVPFCAARCDYCSFATWTDRHHLTDAYLAACRADADRLVADGLPEVTSVFVGGGTPSMVPPGGPPGRARPGAPGRGVRGHRRVQPRRRVRRGLVDTYLAGGVNRHLARACSRRRPTCSPRSGAPTTATTSSGPWRSSARPACRRSTST